MSATARSVRGFIVLACARGAALFFGFYSVANTLAASRSADPSQDLWWIDLRFLTYWWVAGFGVVASVVLLSYGVAPRLSAWRRWLTTVTCAALCLFALQNVTTFYRLWGAGTFTPGVVFPFSLLIALAFALLAWAAWTLRPPKAKSPASTLAAVIAAIVVALLFPLAQIAFFGTSDYRAKADVAVVFGAKVFPDGGLSPSLRDRMDTAVGLYRSGLVKRMVLSGAVGSEGVDEPEAMRAYAVKAGVPSSAIILDHKGVDTDATVRNTLPLFADGSSPQRVLAVSQGYHLPRIKLAYRAAGVDVRTVPAGALEPIAKTPLFIAREVPAFWTYWLRAWARDMSGR